MKNIRVWPLGESINTKYYEQDLRDACRSKQFKLFKGLVDKNLKESLEHDEVKSIYETESLDRITMVKFEIRVWRFK